LFGFISAVCHLISDVCQSLLVGRHTSTAYIVMQLRLMAIADLDWELLILRGVVAHLSHHVHSGSCSVSHWGVIHYLKIIFVLVWNARSGPAVHQVIVKDGPLLPGSLHTAA